MKIDSIKIKLLLAEQQLTQTDMSAKCGVSQQNISTILLRGTCSPATVGKLAKALGVDAREIVKEE